MKKGLLFLALGVFILAGCSTEKINEAEETKKIVEEQSKKLAEDVNKMNGNLEQNQSQAKLSVPSEAEIKNYTEKYDGAVLKTNLGNITVEFHNSDSPKTVANFLKLADNDFYDDVKFHRVIPDFMIQAGDPNSKDDDWSDDGIGGPGYKFEDEINDRKLVKGSLAMANAGPNTNGSQFFIVTAEAAPWLDGKHTNFGEVTSGIEVVKKIEATETNAGDHPTSDIVIENVELVER